MIITITLLPNLPGHIAIELSALLMGADIAIEMKREHLQPKHDPLYFTLKLNKVAKKRIAK